MINTKVKGEFSVQVIRDGIVIKEIGRNSNLILQGKMSNLDEFGHYLHIGTGNTTPSFSDTSLVNELANVLATNSGTGWVPSTSVLVGDSYQKEVSFTFEFPFGSVVGNVAELGISPSASTGVDLHTRALFKDGGGLPTVITVTALDQLVVTYFITKYSSMATTISSVIVNAVTIDYTIRPCISVTGKGGSAANYATSIYRGSEFFTNFYMRANAANRISVDPVTFIPTDLGGAGDISTAVTTVITLTATGCTTLHTVSFPISLANITWVSATFSSVTSTALNEIFFQIEFNGPNYITKTSSEVVTFKIKEIIDQVI